MTARIQEPFGEEHRQEESGEGLVLLAGTLHGKLNVGLNVGNNPKLYYCYDEIQGIFGDRESRCTHVLMVFLCCAIHMQKQTCEMDDQGNVVIKYDGVDMIKINAKGDVILDTHGRHERAVAKSLSYTLMPIGIKFSTSNMQSYDESDWNVSDGYSLMRFYDGIELKGKGYAHYNRGKLVADAFIALRKTRVPGFQGSMEALGQGEEEHVEDDVQEMHM